ncbi:hypothetical protein RRF57_010361 [Xylaria bambusicola]|uniref:Uncharacterized protein n=1 Tax=Xylaria bambusicola TaxID=326684 RepID=A0AAN7US61_9PEZI
MAQVSAEKVAFWELEPNDAGQVSVVPHPLEPCIRGSGVSDIGIFPEEERMQGCPWTRRTSSLVGSIPVRFYYPYLPQQPNLLNKWD